MIRSIFIVIIITIALIVTWYIFAPDYMIRFSRVLSYIHICPEIFSFSIDRLACRLSRPMLYLNTRITSAGIIPSECHDFES